MATISVRLAGTGGQGLILAGLILIIVLVLTLLPPSPTGLTFDGDGWGSSTEFCVQELCG